MGILQCWTTMLISLRCSDDVPQRTAAGEMMRTTTSPAAVSIRVKGI